MATDIPLRCKCGKLRGIALSVSPRNGCRVVCYCHDCQAFARFLAQPGTTDAWGGTDIFQMAPASVRITDGAEALGCMLSIAIAPANVASQVGPSGHHA